MYDSSTDSESSLPWVKLSATDFPMLKMLLDIKALIGNYHNEVIQLQLESESKHDHDPKGKSLFAIFSCLICKDTVNEDSRPEFRLRMAALASCATGPGVASQMEMASTTFDCRKTFRIPSKKPAE